MSSTSKALKSQLKRENVLLHELFVAKELHMSLGQLRREMTYEELWLWIAYFGLTQDMEKEAIQKSTKGRR